MNAQTVPPPLPTPSHHPLLLLSAGISASRVVVSGCATANHIPPPWSCSTPAATIIIMISHLESDSQGFCLLKIFFFSCCGLLIVEVFGLFNQYYKLDSLSFLETWLELNNKKSEVFKYRTNFRDLWQAKDESLKIRGWFLVTAWENCSIKFWGPTVTSAAVHFEASINSFSVSTFSKKYMCLQKPAVHSVLLLSYTRSLSWGNNGQ